MFGALSAVLATPAPVHRVVRWCRCCDEGLGYKNSDVPVVVRGNPRIFLDPSPSVDFSANGRGVKRDVENKIKDIEKKLTRFSSSSVIAKMPKNYLI